MAAEDRGPSWAPLRISKRQNAAKCPVDQLSGRAKPESSAKQLISKYEVSENYIKSDTEALVQPSGSKMLTGPQVPARNLIYQALDHSKSEIRTLKLLPGRTGEDIRVELKTTSLDGPCDYEALSYAWEARPGTETITVNGQSGFTVTGNLYDALSRLRHASKKKKLWIDAICIDQRDNHEKSLQVGIMGEIFKRARQLRIWIGDTGRVAHPMDQQHIRGQSPKVSIMGKIFQRARQQRIWIGGTGGMVSPKYTGEDWSFTEKCEELKSVIEQIQSIWWRRTWVLQEYALWTNRDREPLVSFGRVTVPWSEFLNLTSAHRLPENGWELHYCVLKDIGKLAYTKHIELRRAMDSFRDCEATDPRDKVYSILPLISDSDVQAIAPDYSKSCGEVYAEATAAVIASERSLAILDHVAQNEGEARGHAVLPSWAVDFSANLLACFPSGTLQDSVAWHADQSGSGFLEWSKKTADHRNCFCNLTPRPLTNAPGKLRLQGLYFDQIILQTPESSFMDNDEYIQKNQNHAKLWKQACENMNICCPYLAIGGQNRWKNKEEEPSLVPSLSPKLWEIFGSAVEDAYMYPKFGKWYTVFETWENLVNSPSEAAHLSRPTWKWKFYFGYRANAESNFLTQNGFIGVARPNIKLGDQIVLVHASAAPVVLRPSGDEYTFQGFAYVHGIMEGELEDRFEEFREHRDFIVR